VFLGGNDLPQRWRGLERFVVLETGFGLGLNFLATWQAWREDPQRSGCLHFISFEKHLLSGADLATAHKRWPELAELAGLLQERWPGQAIAGEHRIDFDNGQLTLTLYCGDAEDHLSQCASGINADAFFLDGFSPAKNPALWTLRLFKLLAGLAASGATLATWTVAGAVRQGLAAAGFAVTRAPGFGNKREMLRGVWTGV